MLATMSKARPDPAPRTYPASVVLQRRSARGRPVAPAAMSVEAVEVWLLGDAVKEDDPLLLYESLLWRLVSARLPLDRASLHVGTLHPRFLALRGTGTATTDCAMR
jgi:adenylate cyclase